MPFFQFDYTSFSTPLPTNYPTGGCLSWRLLLQAQHTMMRCIRWNSASKRVPLRGSQTSESHRMFEELDGVISSLLASCVPRYLEVASSDLSNNERCLDTSLMLQAHIVLQSARIKLHDRLSFQDRAISIPDCAPGPAANMSPAQPQGGSSGSKRENCVNSACPKVLTDFALPHNVPSDSADYSIARKICVESALKIAKSFRLLALYTPSDGAAARHAQHSPFPRMLPSFAYYAVQSSDVLLACIRSSSRLSDPTHLPPSEILKRIDPDISNNIQVLNDYCTIFEAIEGMRGR
jgi:hypothetical protein